MIEEGRNRILLKNRKIRFSVSHEFPFFRSRKPNFFQGGVYPLTHYVRFLQSSCLSRNILNERFRKEIHTKRNKRTCVREK